MEQFKTMHIDKALQHNGIMTQDAAELLLMKAKEEHDKGLLNEEQFNAVMKQIIQVIEVSFSIKYYSSTSCLKCDVSFGSLNKGKRDKFHQRGSANANVCWFMANASCTNH